MATQNGPISSFVPAEHQEAVSAALQSSLVDLIDLSLVAKQLHWSVVGPRFQSVHEALDEVVADARTFTDEVAERATAVGVSPDGRAKTVSADSALDEASAEFASDDKVIRVITEALAATIKRLRANIEKVGGDPVTEDLLIGISARFEQLHWMWEAKAA
ncbi:MAG TPA: DNA starvation/stationary phase protection protein [Candidatus Dietzia intestinigallinarum]|nr:DNA starvation/stationary phase protection protein [Candidatus Dietzia intestinigallinarum]